MSNRKGFTLVEMVVVAAIVSVMIGLIVPVYLKLKPTMRVNGAARQIMTDLMWARMKAVASNNNFVVVFGAAGPDLTNDTYYIYDDSDNDFGSVGAETGELVKTVDIADGYTETGYGFVAPVSKPTGGTLNSGDDPVTFSSSADAGNVRWFHFAPAGSANKSGGIYVIPDRDENGSRLDRMRAITVLRSTGRVRIYNYTGTAWK